MITAKRLHLMIFVFFLLPTVNNAGEVMSVNPLFTEKDAVVAPMIEGTWYNKSGDTIALSRAGDNFYHLEIIQYERPVEYEAVMIQIVDRFIFDIFPKIPDGDPAPYPRSHIGLHSFYNISIRDDTLWAAPVNYEWFREMAAGNTPDFQYTWFRDGLLLTGSTSDISNLFLSHRNDEFFWGKEELFKKSDYDNKTAHPIEKRELTHSTNDDTVDTEKNEQNNYATSCPECEPDFPYLDGWLGGDAALSIPISRAQNLWIFSDSFVGLKDQRTRSGSHMVANTIAISTCDEKQKWRIEYFWRDMYTENPKPFFESHTKRYKYWPREVFTHQDNLYVALSKVGPKPDAASDDIFPFIHIGSSIAKISNFRTAPPDEWVIELIPWSSVIESDNWSFLAKHKDHLYVMYRHTDETTFLLRIPLASLAEPEKYMEYLATDMIWRRGFDPTRAHKIFKESKSGGGSLHYHEELHRWIAVYGPQFLDNKIFMFTAPDIIGPWSKKTVIYTPPELIPGNESYDRSYFCYAAREHLQFYDKKANKLLIIYDCNSSELNILLSNMDIYRPRVISVPVPR